MIKPMDIEARLSAAAPAGIQFTQDTDGHGVTCAWCVLASHDDLLAVAARLKVLDARLSTITVFQPKAPSVPTPKEGEAAPLPATFFGGVENGGKAYEVDYHFDLDGATLTLVVHIPAGGAVESLTELYRGAEYVVDFLPKTKIEAAVDDAIVERAIEAIETAARTGKIGDGKIFLSRIDEAIRIRNDERGDGVL